MQHRFPWTQLDAQRRAQPVLRRPSSCKTSVHKWNYCSVICSTYSREMFLFLPVLQFSSSIGTIHTILRWCWCKTAVIWGRGEWWGKCNRSSRTRRRRIRGRQSLTPGGENMWNRIQLSDWNIFIFHQQPTCMWSFDVLLLWARHWLGLIWLFLRTLEQIVFISLTVIVLGWCSHRLIYWKFCLDFIVPFWLYQAQLNEITRCDGNFTEHIQELGPEC